MLDLYLFNTIINAVWYVFTILFVLYKFTSFFGYIYNFIKFCSKLFNGVQYVWNQIDLYVKRRRGYVHVDIETDEILLPDENIRQATLFEKCKSYLKNTYSHYYSKLFKKSNTIPSSNTNNIQLFETHVPNSDFDIKKAERDLFEKHMDELYENHNSMYATNNNNSIFFESKNSSNFAGSSNLQTTNHNTNNSDELYFYKNLTSTHKNTHPLSDDDENENDNMYASIFSDNDTYKRPFNVVNSNLLFQSKFIKNQFGQDNSIIQSSQSSQKQIPQHYKSISNASDVSDDVSDCSNTTIHVNDESKKKIKFNETLNYSEVKIESNSKDYKNEILKNPYI